MSEAMEVLLSQLKEMTPAEVLVALAEASNERDAAEITYQQASDRLEASLRLNGHAGDDEFDAKDAARTEATYWTIRYWMLRAATVR